MLFPTLDFALFFLIVFTLSGLNKSPDHEKALPGGSQLFFLRLLGLALLLSIVRQFPA
jgi:hypothetical protein